jgi:hypothetical protein
MALKKQNIVFAVFTALLFAGCGGHEEPSPRQPAAAETVAVQNILPVKAVQGSGNGSQLLVPATAVFREGALQGVLVVGDDGRIAVRWISTGHAVAGNLVVLAGLDAGELVVGSYDPALREGITVTKSQTVTEEVQSK